MKSCEKSCQNCQRREDKNQQRATKRTKNGTLLFTVLTKLNCIFEMVNGHQRVNESTSPRDEKRFFIMINDKQLNK